VANPGTITTTHGTVTLAPTAPSLTRHSELLWHGLVYIRATDGQAVSSFATVTITIAAVNDAPVSGRRWVSTTEDHSISGNVLTNDTDIEAAH